MSKHLTISSALEEQIRSGCYAHGKIPGVRAIAQEFNTSVVTASRALHDLASRGIISTVQRSGSFVRNAPHSPTETWALCLRVTHGPWQSQTESITRDGFEAAGRAEGFDVRSDLFSFTADTPESSLRRQIRSARDAGVSGVFFLPSRSSESGAAKDAEFLAGCRDVGLPVVLIERKVRGNRPLTTDLVAYDDLEANRALTQHLLDIGRRRIACVVGSPTSSHETRLAGYLLALTRSNAASPPVVIDQPPEVPAKEAYARIADRLLAVGADGVVCYQDHTAIGVILELLNRGRRVPGDVAVAGFEDLPIGNAFAIGVTTYAFPGEEVARRAVQLMRTRIANPSAPPVYVVIPGRLVVRESTTGTAGQS